MIYVDTSAFLAVVHASDDQHERAFEIWQNLIENNERLMCNNYVLVESIALVQHRVGMEALAILHNEIIPYMEVEWLDESLHNTIVNPALTTNRRQLSLVDLSSFDTMRRHKIKTAFTFDSHFGEQGFEVIP
jgi:predicted nucleic acid-binding protein